MSLAHGVENRCPFLDQSIVNFANSVNLKFDDGFTEKYLLKKAFREKLPNKIIEKSKFPYRAPDSAAFVNFRPDYLDLLFSDKGLEDLDFLNVNFAKQLIKKIFTFPPSQISTKENQTFVFLLSIVLLNHFFIKKNIPNIEQMVLKLESILVKIVDERKRVL